jgi:hypothetical protein
MLSIRFPVTFVSPVRIVSLMRKHSLRIFLVAPVLFFLLCATLAPAQDSAAIAGKVTDSKGVPIPGASVSVSLDSGKPVETLTDLDGSFKFQDLPAGAYQLTIEIMGFLKASKSAVEASADSSRGLSIQLEPVPPPVRPKVLPSASKQALPQQRQEQQPQQEQTLSAQVFQTAAVTDLPGLNQFQQDLQDTGSTTGAASRQESLVFVNGNSASLDAGSLNEPGFMGQMMDAARQMGFQIQEFGSGGLEGPGGSGGGPGGGGPGRGGPGGGGPGGGMGFTGMMGRGGRGASFRQPKVEGNASETYSNSALNARNYSLTGKTLEKPVQIQNNFSVTLGGVLPFFKSKSTSTSGTTAQRGFGGRGPVSQPGWSFTYSGNRNRSAQDILTTVPTDLERAGDFTQTYTQALSVDPATGVQTIVNRPVALYLDPNDPFSKFTKIPSINVIAGGLLEFIPKANIACAANAPCVHNYALQRSLPTKSDQIQASVTGLRLTSKDNFGVNYSMRRGNSLNAGIFPGLDTDRTNFGQNIGISGMHSFKPRLIANWRVSLNRMRTESTNKFSYNRDVEGELGITGVSPDPINWGPPTISFTGYGGLSLAAPSVSTNQTFQVSVGVNKIGAKHSIRTGIDISWAQRNSRSDSNGRGTYTFTGYATVLLDAQGSQVSGTGNDFADFLLGLPYSTSRRYVDPSINPYGNAIYLRNRSWNLYIMDDWRVRSNFTVNYGLRYEYSGPSYEKYDRMVSLDANSNFSELAQVFPNEKGLLSGQYFPRSLVNPDRNNLSPRIGIAWRPKLRSPFVIRAGYGLGFNAGGFSSITGQLVNQAPFAVTQNLATDRTNPLTLQIGFPTNPAVTIQNTYAIDPHYRASYAQQWSLSIQAQLFRLYALTVAYDGSKGTGLDILRAPNRSSSASNFVYQTNGANSIYHGLNVQFSRRYSHGFNVMGSYTFSKSIDNASGGGSTVAQNDVDLAAERSLSSQDRRHNFQTNLVYELPFGQNRAFFAGASTKLLNFISGWTFNGSFALSSGSPLTARYASSNGNTSGAALYNSLRPDGIGIKVSLPRSERTTAKFFNTAAFAPPAGLYGTAGRNTIIGPGTNSVNMSVRKSFRLDESNRRLDFSWQVQNLFNHPNWSGVSTTINSLNYGQVTSVRAMRSMTMDLRIRF